MPVVIVDVAADCEVHDHPLVELKWDTVVKHLETDAGVSMATLQQSVIDSSPRLSVAVVVAAVAVVPLEPALDVVEQLEPEEVAGFLAAANVLQKHHCKC